jgi:outer membrane receptor protein involved in Fe transport
MPLLFGISVDLAKNPLGPTLMNTQPRTAPSHPLLKLALSGFALMTIATSIVNGQVAPPPAPETQPAPTSEKAKPAADQAVVELSPFVISADQDKGWIATQTLAGSRLNTNLGDLAQPLQVLTKGFLDDISANNFEQALEYSTNISGPLEFSDNSNNTGIGFGNQQAKNDNLVRGLANGTNSVDFFATSMPADSYNLERITIARGPNALLFGMGSPSGIIDSSLRRGDLHHNSLEVSGQVTSDQNRRETFDVNQVIVRDKLALHLDALDDLGLTHEKPNRDHQTRYYGAITAQPFKNTNITANYEHTYWNGSRARSQLPTDDFSTWLTAASLAGSPYAVNRPIFNNGGTAALPNLTANPIFTGPATNANIIGVVGGFGPGLTDGTVYSFGHSVTSRGYNSVPAAINPFNSFDQFTASLYGPIDPVPHNVNVFGTSQWLRQKNDDWRVKVEQTIAPNLYFEGAWYHESYFSQLADAGFTGLVYVDANQFLPDGATPNPNVGRYFTQRGGQANGNQVAQDKRDDYRATLSYDLDLRDRLGWVGKWLLGRLRPVGLVEQDNLATRSQTFNRDVLDNPVLPGVLATPFTTGSIGTGATGTGTKLWATNANRSFTTRMYLNGPDGNSAINDFGDVFAPVWTFKDANGNPYHAYTSATPYTSAQGYPLISGSTPGGSLQKTKTAELALQDYVLDDRLVLLYGIRHDEAKTAGIDQKYQQQDWSGLYPSYAATRFGAWQPTQKGNTQTEGIVAHVTPWLSGLFNHSTTFQPNTGIYDPFGNPIPGAEGRETDYGVSFNLLNDKLLIKLTHYENTDGPVKAANSPFQDPLRGDLNTINLNIQQLDPALPLLNPSTGGFDTLGNAAYNVTLNNQSKGYELEASWRPTENWDIIVNGAKSTVVQSNIGVAFINWINARLPVWQAATTTINGQQVNIWNTQPYDNTPGDQTFAQYFQSTIQNQLLGTFAAYEGSSSDQGRGYSSNFISEYRFTSGWLKGVAANLAFRYRSGATIGYHTTTSAAGVLLLDKNRPITGPWTVFTDAGLIYKGKIEPLKGIRYRVQLNIRNLFNEFTLVPVKAFTTGAYGRWQELPPRTYVVSTTFDY